MAMPDLAVLQQTYDTLSLVLEDDTVFQRIVEGWVNLNAACLPTLQSMTSLRMSPCTACQPCLQLAVSCSVFTELDINDNGLLDVKEFQVYIEASCKKLNIRQAAIAIVLKALRRMQSRCQPLRCHLSVRTQCSALKSPHTKIMCLFCLPGKYQT